MNARTPAATLEAPFDVTDVDAVETKTPITALVPVVANVLEITEVLDAKAKDGEKAIVNITPLQYDVTADTLRALHDEFAGKTYDVTTPDGRAAAKAAVSKLTKVSTGMENAYKTWNGPIMAMTKHARAQKDKVGEAVELLKAPIAAALDAAKRAEEEAEAKRAAAESARITAQEKALADLHAMPNAFVKAPSADIAGKIAEVSSFEFLAKRDWQEFSARAADHQREVIEKLREHHTNALAREKLAELEEANAKAEQQRATEAAIADRITKITMAPMSVFGKTAAEMRGLIARLDSTDATTFGEKAEDAAVAIATARDMVQVMLTSAEAAEAKAAEAQAQADELTRLQNEEQERIAREARELAEREAAAAAEAAELERQTKELAAKQAREQAEREAAERRAVEDAARAARERAEAQAEKLLALLVEALPHVAANDADLATRMTAVIDAAKGE